MNYFRITFLTVTNKEGRVLGTWTESTAAGCNSVCCLCAPLYDKGQLSSQEQILPRGSVWTVLAALEVTLCRCYTIHCSMGWLQKRIWATLICHTHQTQKNRSISNCSIYVGSRMFQNLSRLYWALWFLPVNIEVNAVFVNLRVIVEGKVCTYHQNQLFHKEM